METLSGTNEQATLIIDDMACDGCVGTVQDALNNIDGVEKAEADHKKGTAKVSYNAETVSTDDFKQAVEEAGYTFKGIE